MYQFLQQCRARAQAVAATMASVYIRAMPDVLESLNSTQQRAAAFGTELMPAEFPRPLLIIAGAGTGKTRTLAHRVAQLIVAGADPRRILLLTFTRRAAIEMTRRAERIVSTTLAGRHAPGRVEWSGTF